MNIKELIKNYRRVMQIARKPNKEEFLSTGKICAIGLLLIGFIGFIIFLPFILLGDLALIGFVFIAIVLAAVLFRA
ncbi:MAG: protein translocase SEC61 complex subunit gamma [Candidatus Aenigmarchaeota archaeon]|nr:protein translocase SEC61 complex subunit gamma [Candidatus Aenigmarchaeota archaeon]NIP40693.1 protein translocase SEC61 complex subunit gamma [Candidatus Aenigmarchaeota archaeon]NIQ18499.1 protein translocase SEC61 complex subunit gamma [Candidatus Aenigmarchaeota archaeon]NIS73398.1 protein translocase SEC61 complex subunit gamma [Candidatus Aenigmarchaeota archaeon]